MTDRAYTTDTPADERPVDEAAASFLDLEQELTETGASVGTNTPVRGQFFDVDRVDSATVPESYPWQVTICWHEERRGRWSIVSR